MTKPNLANLLKQTKVFVDERSPEILMGVGIVGMITTTILAVKATPKALALIEEEKLRKYRETDNDSVTKIEAVKVAWKPYIPAVITGIASTACLVGSSSVSTRRTAALAAAYQISETALTEYKAKVVETIGERKEQLVKDKVAKDRIEKNPVSKSEVIVTNGGVTLCFDPVSGRYFKSNIERIKRAENDLNKRMLHDITGYVSLNEFYDELDLEQTSIGDDLGWNTDNLIDISFSSQIADNGEPSIVLDFRVAPKYGYSKYL